MPDAGENVNQWEYGWRGESAWHRSGILILQPKDDKLVVKRNFAREAAKSVLRLWLSGGNQRLYVNPANEKLYLVEVNTGGRGGQFTHLPEIDPQSYAVREIPIPTASGTVCENEGGLWVSPKGRIAVSCSTRGPDTELDHLARKSDKALPEGKPYKPSIYPGRRMLSITACVHVWDEHGQLVHEDAIPGMSQVDGVAIDSADNLYIMTCPTRILDGKPYFNWLTGTLIKMQPNKGKFVSDDRGAVVPLPPDLRPQRHPDLYGGYMGRVWVDGAEWFYGGIGDCSFKIATGCCCWQTSRFTLDYFARTFAPETDQFSVAVLDTNGNLILRIGRYGNVDDGLPLVRDARQPPNARSIGGDEVSLMHPSYVATLSDRYLYIGDVGNGRVVRVKLGYHAEEKVALKDAKDMKKTE